VIYLNENISEIVIKVGSSSLSNENGIDEDKIRNIVEQVSTLKKVGKDIVIVSSGAIAAGMAELGYKKKPSLLIEKQACFSSLDLAKIPPNNLGSILFILPPNISGKPIKSDIFMVFIPFSFRKLEVPSVHIISTPLSYKNFAKFSNLSFHNGK
jgi:hypothetical protein